MTFSTIPLGPPKPKPKKVRKSKPKPTGNVMGLGGKPPDQSERVKRTLLR